MLWLKYEKQSVGQIKIAKILVKDQNYVLEPRTSHFPPYFALRIVKTVELSKLSVIGLKREMAQQSL